MLSRLLRRPFRYLTPGPLIDGELQLLPPAQLWVEPLLAACHHPLTVAREPAMAATTRQQVLAFIDAHPDGHLPVTKNHPVPAYTFWMRITIDDPARFIAGAIALRVGRSADIERYVGHIGYHVYPPSRGHHYAERSTRLLLPLVRRHRINPLWITCNPDNLASRRTCERLHARLINIVDLPPDHPLYAAGDRQKCRYRLDL